MGGLCISVTFVITYSKSILMHCSTIIQVIGIIHAKIESSWSSSVTLFVFRIII